MTVKELRDLLTDLPDNMLVGLTGDSDKVFAYDYGSLKPNGVLLVDDVFKAFCLHEDR